MISRALLESFGLVDVEVLVEIKGWEKKISEGGGGWLTTPAA